MTLEKVIDANGEEYELKLRFPRESYVRYRSESVEELLRNDNELLIHFINHHKTKQAPRLKELLDYARGFNHGILKDENRRKENDMSDMRAVHNFGGLFSTLEQGFIAGVPIRVEYLDDTDLQEALNNIAIENDFKRLNRSLIKSASQMGRAYDIVYYSGDKIKVRKLNPIETFVIFDQTLSEHSIAAVRYYTIEKLGKIKTYVEFYTADYSTTYEFDNDKLIELEGKEPHGFSKVPITEYRRNELGIGSYETVLSLIDTYDANQSDTANYMNDLSDAILAVFGNISFPDGMNAQEKLDWMKNMRRARLMLLKPSVNNNNEDLGQVDARYLTKSYDVAGAEAQKSRIERDIHKFANMPNLNDDSFGGVQSGEALKYKMMGLEQEVTDIQAEFESGLRRRYELIAIVGDKINLLKNFDMAGLKVTFTLNLPKSLQEMVTTLKELGGIVSNETALRISGLVEDVEEELALLESVTPSGYDGEKRPDNSYKILAITNRFKRGDISETQAIKLLGDLNLEGTEAREYLGLPEVTLDGLV